MMLLRSCKQVPRGMSQRQPGKSSEVHWVPDDLGGVSPSHLPRFFFSPVSLWTGGSVWVPAEMYSTVEAQSHRSWEIRRVEFVQRGSIKGLRLEEVACPSPYAGKKEWLQGGQRRRQRQGCAGRGDGRSACCWGRWQPGLDCARWRPWRVGRHLQSAVRVEAWTWCCDEGRVDGRSN